MKNSEKDNKLLSKTQQRFKSEKRNVFTEEINKIALSSNGDKTIQSIDSILIASKDLVCKKRRGWMWWYNKTIQKWLTLMCYKRKHKRAYSTLATNSRSSLQIISNWRFWVWKNKFMI